MDYAIFYTLPKQGTIGIGIICNRSGGINELEKSERLILLSNLISKFWCSSTELSLESFMTYCNQILVQEHDWTLFSGVFDLIHCFLGGCDDELLTQITD